MTTDMPEVIWAYSLIWEDSYGAVNEDMQWRKFSPAIPLDFALNNKNGQSWCEQYIRTDKHEELKAIAEKMAFSLKKISMMPNHYGEMRKEATNALTEYNKYKGE